MKFGTLQPCIPKGCNSNGSKTWCRLGIEPGLPNIGFDARLNEVTTMALVASKEGSSPQGFLKIHCPNSLDYIAHHGLPVSTVYTTIIRHPTFCCSLQFSSFLTIGTIPAKPITCSKGQIRGPPRFLGISVTVKKFQLLA